MVSQVRSGMRPDISTSATRPDDQRQKGRVPIFDLAARGLADERFAAGAQQNRDSEAVHREQPMQQVHLALDSRPPNPIPGRVKIS